MKKLFLSLTGLFLFLAFFVSRAKAENIVADGVEHINSYDVTMDINADSTIYVTETINYDYGTKDTLGFTRYIPLTYQDLDGTDYSVSVTNLGVTGDDGSQYAFAQSPFQSDDKKKSYLQIDIGDENHPVTGNKTYIIRYTLSGAIKFMAGSDELFWNITGDKWPIYIKYPQISINLPQRVDRDKVTDECFIGLHEATVECIDRIENRKDPDAYYSYKGVVAGEGMTAIIKFPKGIVQKKIAPKQNFWGILKTDRRVQEIFFLVISLLIALVILFVVYFKKIASLFSRKKWSEKLSLIREKIKFHHIKNIHAKVKSKSKKWRLTAGITLAILFISGGAIFWKVENVLNKVSVKGESIGSIVHAGFDNQSQIKGETDGRINILLLGILGANHPGGGLNTDTIMVASIEPVADKISLISIPRDLWVTDPGKDTKSKINAVYAYGEEKGPGQGIADAETMVGYITGVPIDYTAVLSTEAFAQLVDTLGGVDVNLSSPFDESAQFTDINVCDSDTYTVPTGDFKTRTKKGKVVSQYPLCKNKNPECGGDFHLPAGKNTLSGQQALCFVRSRYQTSDFERAKRQQLLLQQLKLKVTALGFADFGKADAILNNLGSNVRTDMQLWEMRRLFDIYKGMDNAKMYQRVLEDSKEGLLTAPDPTSETGYILLPRGDNYDQIRNMFQTVFDSGNQSDIKPKV